MKLSIKSMTVTAALLWAGAFFLVSVANLFWPSYGGAFLEVMGSLYPGYDPMGTVGSVVVGTLYALLDGALGGFVLAWLYNCLAR